MAGGNGLSSIYLLERQRKIWEYVKKERSVSVHQLSELFQVHEATIRRDLEKLEQHQMLIRTHGGAIVENEIYFEPSFNEREITAIEEKKAIGNFASSFIQNGDHLFIDAGSTTLQMVDEILKKKNLRIITNDINIAYQLRFSSDHQVLVTGGNLYQESFMLTGFITVNNLESIFVHKAFIGTLAFHHEYGLTHFNEQVVASKRAMIERAKEVYVLADHTKIGKLSMHQVGNVEQLDFLITSDLLSDEQKKNLNTTSLNIFYC